MNKHSIAFEKNKNIPTEKNVINWVANDTREPFWNVAK